MLCPSKNLILPQTWRDQKDSWSEKSKMDDKYICLACGKSYTAVFNIKKHLQLHLGIGLHVCSSCGYTTGHKHAYDAHMRIHSGEKPYKCEGCGRRFSDRSNFGSHNKRCI